MLTSIKRLRVADRLNRATIVKISLKVYKMYANPLYCYLDNFMALETH